MLGESARVVPPPVPARAAGNGIVCAIDHLAASAGVGILRGGGSAVDAAVAASAVLAVTSQHMCGMGGDLWAVVHPGGEETPVVLNASGRAGSGADPERLRARGLDEMPDGEIPVVPVPGCVDGWLALHRRFGRLALADVLDPARRYADDGFPASPGLALAIGEVARLPEAGDYRVPGGVRTGTVIRRPGVARTLAAVAAGGRDAFYGGEFGDRLIALGAGEFAEEDLTRPHADFWVALAALGFLQVTASILNFIPVPGLDGGNIIRPWLNEQYARAYNLFAPYGFILLFLLLWQSRINVWFFSFVGWIAGAIGIPDALGQFGLFWMRFWSEF